jgi:hypothetical protein
MKRKTILVVLFITVLKMLIDCSAEGNIDVFLAYNDYFNVFISFSKKIAMVNSFIYYTLLSSCQQL